MKTASLLAGLVLLYNASCSQPAFNFVDAEAAMLLLDNDQVKEYGITHSGLVIFTLKNGTHLHVPSSEIGTIEDIRRKCSNCQDVTYYIE